jgi:hypothetical protein
LNLHRSCLPKCFVRCPQYPGMTRDTQAVTDIAPTRSVAGAEPPRPTRQKHACVRVA